VKAIRCAKGLAATEATKLAGSQLALQACPANHRAALPPGSWHNSHPARRSALDGQSPCLVESLSTPRSLVRIVVELDVNSPRKAGLDAPG